MSLTYKHGEAEVKALAQQAGKAHAAQVKLDQRFRKDMAMMDYQFKLQSEMRSRSWDLEKMEIASRNDFAQEEKLRVRKQEQWNTIKTTIEEDQNLTDQEKSSLLLNNRLKIYGGAGPKEKSIEEQMLEEALNKQRGQSEQAPAQRTPRGGGIVETAEGMQFMSPEGELRPLDQTGMVNVVNPSGERVKIKASQLQEALAEGYQFIGVSAATISQPTQGSQVSQEGPEFSQEDVSFLKPPIFNLIEMFKAKEAVRKKREEKEGPYSPGKRVRSGLRSVGRLSR